MSNNTNQDKAEFEFCLHQSPLQSDGSTFLPSQKESHYVESAFPSSSANSVFQFNLGPMKQAYHIPDNHVTSSPQQVIETSHNHASVSSSKPNSHQKITKPCKTSTRPSTRTTTSSPISHSLLSLLTCSSSSPSNSNAFTNPSPNHVPNHQQHSPLYSLQVCSSPTFMNSKSPQIMNACAHHQQPFHSEIPKKLNTAKRKLTATCTATPSPSNSASCSCSTITTTTTTTNNSDSCSPLSSSCAFISSPFVKNKAMNVSGSSSHPHDSFTQQPRSSSPRFVFFEHNGRDKKAKRKSATNFTKTLPFENVWFDGPPNHMKEVMHDRETPTHDQNTDSCHGRYVHNPPHHHHQGTNSCPTLDAKKKVVSNFHQVAFEEASKDNQRSSPKPPKSTTDYKHSPTTMNAFQSSPYREEELPSPPPSLMNSSSQTSSRNFFLSDSSFASSTTSSSLKVETSSSLRPKPQRTSISIKELLN
ncbi:hypothetical protein C9374_002840 [Naegleria lovaniensis]|uniref:Uncharacterized protein n=1 Tax=Naegleria lovaniensis TaxID=51637 RepID=A0AA88KM04_NAELO|nr:uncharacterized protein C9374_002840 [Naegleria lovaniensis]KAG2386394.1 hypothetical protein C9374_002840 [Naegleria lovaniensis]